MKRKLVKEDLNTRTSSPRKSLREGNGLVAGINKRTDTLRKLFREGNRLATDLNKKIGPPGKSLREGNRSEPDLKSLKDVQSQIDNLIGLMINTKLLLAELSIGGDEVWAENSTSSEWEEGELE
jgi:hypothetical protein